MNIEELTSKGIPEKIANFLISYFNGDLEKVYLVLNSVKKDIIVLKIKFSFSIYAGISIIFLNTRNSKIEFIKCFVSPSNEITKINIEMPWYEIIRKILESYKNLQIDPDISRKAENLISSDYKFYSTISKLFSEDKTEIDVRRFLYTYIPTLLGDQNAVVRFNIEKIDLFQFYRFMKNLEIELPESLKSLESEDFFTKYSILDLLLEPVLSPLDGVSISNIHIGEKIYVKILENDDISKVFQKGDTTEAKIISISPLDNERYLVSVEIGPGFLGKFIIKNNVKVKKVSPEIKTNQITDIISAPNVHQSKEVDYNYTKEETTMDIEEEIQREKNISALIWFITISIIILGVAGVLILLLFF